MAIERNLIISLLKLTKNGPVLIKDVNQDARIASDIAGKLLEKLQNEDMLYLKEDSVEADSDNRLRLAVNIMNQVKAHYRNYPETLENFMEWKTKTEALFEAARSKLMD